MTTEQQKLVTDNMDIAYGTAYKSGFAETTVCPREELAQIAARGDM